MTPVVTDVAGDHDSKNESTDGDFGARYFSYFFSYSFSVCRGGRCSHSKRSSIASRPIGPQITANRLDQRTAVPAIQTAIEYEYDEIRCEARNVGRNRARASSFSFAKTPDRELRFTALLFAIKASRTLLGIGLPVPWASLQVVDALYSCHTFCRLACTSNPKFPSCQASTFVPF